MSGSRTESFVVRILEKDGQRKAERKPLVVPFDVATGRYERLSDLQLRELTKDLKAEKDRRNGTPKWDPYAAIITHAAPEETS